MTFDDNACIRYLMKEMDPSEEMLFEKKMMEDENLLIEVESLRKVYKRMAGLPDSSPPQELCNRIIEQAAEHYNRKNRDYRTFYFSAAATIAVLFLSGAFLMYENGTSSGEEGDASRATIGSSAATTPSAFELRTESTAPGVQPWVDQNQEIHFNDRFDSESAAVFDSIFKNSYERLKPLHEADERRDRARGLQLTGSN